MAIFGCKHRQLSRLFTLGGHTYQACFDCGAELEYDLDLMRPTGRRVPGPIVHPDMVAMRRKSLPVASGQI